MVPFLAGLLVFFLLYLANIARKIAAFVQKIPKLTANVVKKAAIELAKSLVEKVIDEFEDRINGQLCDYLKALLDSQIKKKILFKKRLLFVV